MIGCLEWRPFLHVFAGSHRHLGGSESGNGDAEAGETKWRLLGVLCWLVSTMQMFLKKNNLKRWGFWFPIEHTFILYLLGIHLASRYLLSSSYVPGTGICRRRSWLESCPCSSTLACCWASFSLSEKGGYLQGSPAQAHSYESQMKWWVLWCFEKYHTWMIRIMWSKMPCFSAALVLQKTSWLAGQNRTRASQAAW